MGSEVRAEFEELIKYLTDEQLDELILLGEMLLQSSEAELGHLEEAC